MHGAHPQQTSALRSESYLPNGLATLRAQSMKRCATGLSARFFSEMTPMGLWAVADSIGKALAAGLLLAKVNMEAGRMDRNRPPATSV